MWPWLRPGGAGVGATMAWQKIYMTSLEVHHRVPLPQTLTQTGESRSSTQTPLALWGRVMAIHRDYFRPGDPGARPITSSDVTGIARKSYPNSLKTACRKGSAARVPSGPTHCPQCYIKTSYLAQLCYMEGVAGAYVLIVSLQPHDRVHVSASRS